MVFQYSRHLPCLNQAKSGRLCWLKRFILKKLIVDSCFRQFSFIILCPIYINSKKMLSWDYCARHHPHPDRNTRDHSGWYVHPYVYIFFCSSSDIASPAEKYILGPLIIRNKWILVRKGNLQNKKINQIRSIKQSKSSQTFSNYVWFIQLFLQTLPTFHFDTRIKLNNKMSTPNTYILRSPT
mgnify:CR=1 FL=1